VSSSCIPVAFRIFGPDARPRPLPKKLSTPLDATLLSSFSIFRRSALPRDKLSALEPGGGLDEELSHLYELSGYYPAYVRQLATLPDGRRYFVIPAYGRSEAVVPARCLSGGERERRLLVEQEHRLLVEPVDCIIETGNGEDSPSGGCETFAAIDEGGRVFRSDALTKEPIVELVPDGVVSVRVNYREIAPITLPVSENAFMFTPPPPTPHIVAELKRLNPAIVAKSRQLISRWNKTVEETGPTRLEWLDGAGRVIRAIRRPDARTSSVGNLRAPIGG
jgi:hypothetical protein